MPSSGWERRRVYRHSGIWFEGFEMSLRLWSLVVLWSVALAPLSLAQPFVDSTAAGLNGYAVAERTVGSDAFGGAVGTAVDPTDPDAFYYYDGLTIRRYDLAAGSAQGDGAVVFTPPAPAGFANAKGGAYGSFLIFDPADNNSLWFAEASDRNLYVITLDSVNRAQAAANRVAFTPSTGFFIYDVAFDLSGTTPRAYVTAGNFSDTEILALTTGPGQFGADVIGSLTGASGPLDFDAAGNLYYVFPPFSGSGPLAGDQALIVRWEAATVAAAQTVGGSPLTEANRDLATERLLTFAGQPNVFPSVSSILVRQENGRPIVYAGSNDPQGASGTTTGAIMRIDITQASTNDNLLWMPLQSGAVPGKLAAIQRNAGFGADSGQWNEILGEYNGRIYVTLTEFDFTTSPSSIAMIVPNSTMAEIFALAVTAQPAAEHRNIAFDSTVEVRDAGGNRITSGEASTATITLSTILTPTGGALTGPTSANANTGSATFAGLQSAVVGNYTVQYTAGTVSAQEPLVINRIASVSILNMPTSVTFGQPFNATVELRDDEGNRIVSGTGATANVIAAVQTGPSGVVIPPAQGTQAAVGGVVNYVGLTFSVSGNYTITFTAFIGALSQASVTGAIVVQDQVALSAGGSGCAMSPHQERGGAVAILALGLTLGGLLWLRRRTRVGRS